VTAGLDGARIVGVYTTEQGELEGRLHHELLAEALYGAIEDAGMRPAEIDGLANLRGDTKSAAHAPPALWAELLGHPLGYYAMPDVAGASHCASVGQAAAAISAGLCQTVVVLAGGVRGTREEIVQEMASMHGEFDVAWGSIVPSWFALLTRRYMKEYGVTADAMAEVAVAARQWAALHPQAMMKAPITAADVLASRMIADPLRLLDCCLVNNGAGAIVLTSTERSRDCANVTVRVAGAGEAYTARAYADLAPQVAGSGARLSSAHALEMAGATLKDLDVIGLYDAYTSVVLMLLEDLGFGERGDGPAIVADGALRPGGRLHVNPHGGSLSWGHALGGLGHAIEVVRQLQGRAGSRQIADARLGLSHSMGGPLSLHSTIVLERD
jgi:acetyl-CoA acetyltransferase